MKSSLCRIDEKITAINGKLTVIERKLGAALWAVGVNAAATIAILGVLLHHG